jgi:hypothetical protein
MLKTYVQKITGEFTHVWIILHLRALIPCLRMLNVGLKDCGGVTSLKVLSGSNYDTSVSAYQTVTVMGDYPQNAVVVESLNAGLNLHVEATDVVWIILHARALILWNVGLLLYT